MLMIVSSKNLIYLTLRVKNIKPIKKVLIG